VTAAPVVPLVDRVSPPSGASKSERLAALDRLHAAECPHCTTATGYERIVFGEGNPDAEIVFVGEAPGETEDKLGRPFVGRAGEKLDEMIAAMGLSRGDVYIANVLKARPPGNRTPLAHEVERCGPYLLAQLAVVRPKAIVTLGGPATKLLLATELGITRLRGAWANVRLGSAEGTPFDVPVMPTFHPAYLLRNYTPETRRQVWEDLKKVLELLGRPAPQRARS
jgi:DNA polymerase